MPRSEAEWEEAVVEASREAYLAWLRFAGVMMRAAKLACAAEEAGVNGAIRLLVVVPVIDTESEQFQRTLRTGVDRGIATEQEAARAFRGEE